MTPVLSAPIQVPDLSEDINKILRGQIMNKIVFEGIMPALITPFDSNKKIRKNDLIKLIDWQLASGVNGFYICGGTGEGPALSMKTRMEMAEITVGTVAGRGKVLVHTGSINSDETMELTRHATKIGADGISSLPPNFYYSYTDAEIISYYQKLASETDLPVLIYAIQSKAANDTNYIIEKLVQTKNIIGLKDTRRNYYDMWKAKQINAGNINVINGPDEMLICGLSMGADGGIGSTYNVIPEKFVDLYTAFRNGEIEEAQKKQTEINRLVEILIHHGKTGVINSIKSVLEDMGFDVGRSAFPTAKYSADEKISLKADMQKEGFKF